MRIRSFLWHPLALLGLLALVYGRFLDSLGFYWDDWLFAWIRTTLGAEGLVADFATSRPLRGLTEPLFTPLFGLNTVAWQAFSLGVRGLAGIAFWAFLRQLWPQRKAEAWLAAAIFLLYPGFLQQPLAMTYHYFWGVYLVFSLSLILMVRSLRQGKTAWPLYLLSVFFSALQLFASEYLAGLEILRPLIILFVLLEKTPASGAWRDFLRTRRPQILQTTLLEIPYLLTTAAYLYWRFVLFSKLHSSPTYYPTLVESTNQPLSAKLAALFGDLVSAFDWALIKAWLPALRLPDSGGWWLLGILALAMGAWLWISRPAEQPLPARPMYIWVGTGLLGIALSSLPFIVASLPIRFTYPEDRFAMPFLPVVGLFFSGLIFLLPNKSQARLLGAFLLALSINAQWQNNLNFSQEWQLQKNFLWQLTWRAPALRPGTLLLSEDIKTFPYNDYEAIWGMVSWTYAPQSRSKDVPFHYISMRPDVMEKLEAQAERPAVLVYYSPSSCLRVLDPQYDRYLPVASAGITASPPVTLTLPQSLAANLALSNPAGQVLPAPQSTPPGFLGNEPAHEWCYYFQKIDLARQLNEWNTAAQLADQAAELDLRPYDPSEYLPVIEAYAQLWRITEARKLTRTILNIQPTLRPAACAIWQRGQQNPNWGDTERAAAQDMIAEIGVCPIQ